MDAFVIQEIGEDVNFRKLIEDNCSLLEFDKLVEKNATGYSQKRRLSEGLKDFTKKIEDAENRLIVAKNVGKYKGQDPDDKLLTDKSTSFDLKAKLAALNEKLQTMIDDGHITHFEKPHVLDNLRQRLAKAKEAGKPKLEEKLDKMATTVVRAHSKFSLPVTNLEQFFQLDKEINAIEKLKKLNAKTLTSSIKARIEKQPEVQAEFDGLMDASRQWFETPVEFKPRLQEALREHAASEEERKKKEEEEAFEKKLAEENAAVEKKRAAAAKHEAELGAALEEKLKEKREEAALKPVKPITQKVVKEKKVIARVDLQEMFHEEPDYELISAAQIEADIAADAQKKEWAAAYKELAAAMKDAPKPKPKPSPSTKPQASPAIKPAASPEIKGKDASSIAAEKEAKHQTEEEKFAAIDAKLAQKRLDAESKPKKEAAPKKEAPKPKAKKMSLLDFYEEDDLLSKLAAQEEIEKTERAAAAAAAAEEAERLAAEEEAAWAAEEAVTTETVRATPMSLHAQAAKRVKEEKAAEAAAWAEEHPEEAAEAAAAAAAQVVVADAKTAPPPKPKLRKIAVELENKWGAPVAAVQPDAEGDDNDDPSIQELQESLVAGPSLADSLSGPKPVKKPPPQPKKKEKKKWGKIDAGMVGFDDGNLNVYEN